jgi:oligopeptide transport system substrate-binding protein
VPQTLSSLRRTSRRALLQRAPLLIAIGGLLQVSGCSPITFQPSTPVPGPEPLETPASVPEQPDPTPVPTPDPAIPDPSPTPDVPIPAEPVQQVLRVAGTFLDPDRRDPTELPECLSNAMTHAGLLSLDESFQLEPDWAVAWEPLTDQDGWRFRIRVNEPAGESDQPLTASDVASSWLHILESEADLPGRSLLLDVENAPEFLRGEVPVSDVGIVALDDWTLEVVMAHQRETFPAVVTSPYLWPFPPQNESTVNECHWNGRYTVSIFDEVLATLIPNTSYWNDDPPGLQRIEYLAYSPGMALTEFGHGDLDLVKLSGSEAVRLREDSAMESMVVAAMPERLIGLVPDPEVPPFDDPVVRRVISRVIDRRRLELIVEGRVIPAARMFPSGMFPLLDDAAAGIVAQFDVDDAYADLANALYPDPEEWPSFGLDIPALDGFFDRIARDVASQLRENLDIQVPIRVHDPDEYREGVLNREFPFSWLDWTYPYADPAAVYAELIPGWRSEGFRIPWNHAEYDELLLAAEAMESQESRANAWAGCEGLLQEHGAVIPLVHPVDYFLVQPWVEGLPRDGRDRLITGVATGFDFSRNVSIGERPD